MLSRTWAARRGDPVDPRAWLVFFRVRRSDFVVSTVAFLAVALLGVVVIAAEPITDIDTTAAEMLGELNQTLATRGATLAFGS